MARVGESKIENTTIRECGNCIGFPVPLNHWGSDRNKSPISREAVAAEVKIFLKKSGTVHFWCAACAKVRFWCTVCAKVRFWGKVRAEVRFECTVCAEVSFQCTVYAEVLFCARFARTIASGEISRRRNLGKRNHRRYLTESLRE